MLFIGIRLSAYLTYSNKNFVQASKAKAATYLMRAHSKPAAAETSPKLCLALQNILTLLQVDRSFHQKKQAQVRSFLVNLNVCICTLDITTHERR